MENEKKVTEKEEALFETELQREIKIDEKANEHFSDFIEEVRDRLRKHFSRAEWYLSFGEHELVTQERQWHRFYWDLIDDCEKLGSLEACLGYFRVARRELCYKNDTIREKRLSRSMTQFEFDQIFVFKALEGMVKRCIYEHGSDEVKDQVYGTFYKFRCEGFFNDKKPLGLI